jgi:hypothetical protein
MATGSRAAARGTHETNTTAASSRQISVFNQVLSLLLIARRQLK